jgi:pimeloyl-ACP methyl ester carboxylesterase
MAQKTRAHARAARGFSHLAVDAMLGLTDIVESMHATIAYAPGILGPPAPASTQGITGLVYGSIRRITGLIGGTIDAVLGQLVPLLAEPDSSPTAGDLRAALNGVLGDYLVATNNPLMIPMHMCWNGQPLDLAVPSLVTTIPEPRRNILLLVHGLCLHDRHWLRQGHDHGASLAADLGYTPVCLHYNSGLHISTNGRTFAATIEALLRRWPVPVERVVIIGHSMGGLVARSACHYGALAGHTWLRHLTALVFLGTPHHGAPLERAGHWLDVLLEASPYTAALARLGKMRSAGITDLRYGNLLDEDWADRDRFAQAGDRRRPVPLPEGVPCYTIAATTSTTVGDLRAQLLGDGLVPLPSALGHHTNPRLKVPFPASRQWIGYAMNHLGLLYHPEVYEQVRRWLAA